MGSNGLLRPHVQQAGVQDFSLRVQVPNYQILSKIVTYISTIRKPSTWRLMDKILHYFKDPKLWELLYIPYYGSCKILSINRRRPLSDWNSETIANLSCRSLQRLPNPRPRKIPSMTFRIRPSFKVFSKRRIRARGRHRRHDWGTWCASLNFQAAGMWERAYPYISHS